MAYYAPYSFAPSYAAPVFASTVAAPAAPAAAADNDNTHSPAPAATTVLPAPATALFWPPNSAKSKFTIPHSTNYKRWRNTSAELGRFERDMQLVAKLHGLM